MKHLNNSERAVLSFVERVERLEEEKAAMAADIKEVYAEAKGQGFDAKILRKVVALRKIDAEVREQNDALLETYWEACEAAEKALREQSVAEGE